MFPAAKSPLLIYGAYLQKNPAARGLSFGESINDLESLSDGTTSFTLDYSTLGITANVPTVPGGGDIESVFTGGSQGGQYATSPTHFLHAPGDGGFTIAFDSAISAFGLYATDLADAGGTLSLELYNSGTLMDTLAISGIPTGSNQNGAASFIGFIDPDPNYDKIVLGTSGSGEVVGYDDFTVGIPKVASTPLPAALPLFGSGLTVLGYFGLRRRKHKAAPERRSIA